MLRDGKDCTIVALAAMVHRSLEAAEILEKEHGISCTVVDVRSLVPLDTQTILTEVAKTGRLVTVEENPRLCGWGAEIASIVADECFWDLDGPIVRITTPHVPLPSADRLEDATDSVGRAHRARDSGEDRLSSNVKPREDAKEKRHASAGWAGAWHRAIEDSLRERDCILTATDLVLSAGRVAAETADLILVNGKIVTVDDRFTIAQALAIKGQRIVAVGSTADDAQARGRETRSDRSQRADGHPGTDRQPCALRYASPRSGTTSCGSTAITSRKQAIDMLRDRVRAAKPGEWIAALGGWSEEQFTDDARGFPLAELDQIAPNHPGRAAGDLSA